METGDLRHLLDCDELPEYDISILIPVWEDIIKEYEKLTNSFGYTNHLRKLSHNTAKINRLNGLIACVYLVKYQHPDASEYAKFWRVPNTVEGITTVILQEKTRLNIEAVRNKAPKTEVVKFTKLLVDLENALDRNLDVDSITVDKWVYLCKSLEEKAKALENLKHGRTGKNTGR